MATGKLRYAFRNWPIESLHNNAFKAAEAAECAGDQGKFWEMHDRLFADPTKLNPPELNAYARTLNLNMGTFQKCLDGGKYSVKVRKDLADGSAAGISGTPAFFIGPTTVDGQTLRASASLTGAKPYAEFKAAIDDLLARKTGSE